MTEVPVAGSVPVPWWRGLRASPLVYRELRINGCLYGVGTAAMLAPVVLSWFTEQHFLGYLQQVYLQGIGPWQVRVTPWPVVFAGIMALLAFYNDRSRGGLHYVLEGPVRRRDVLGIKAGLLTAAVLLVGVVTALAVAGVSLSLGGAHLGSILVYPLVTTALAESMAMTALAASALMPGLLGAALGAVGFTVLFPLIGDIVVPFYSYAYGLPVGAVPSGRFLPHPGQASLAVLHVEHFLGLATPTAVPLPMGPGGILAAAIFVAWAVFIARVALHEWERVPVEHMDDRVSSPVARGAAFVWWALLGAFAGVSVARTWWYSLHGFPLLGVGVLAASLPWLMWQLFVRARDAARF